MELRPLGRTGMLVSVLGLGTVKLGRNQAVKYPRPFDLPTDAEALALLDTAAALGINLLDTAPAYGSAEERLGKLLAGRRDRWVLSTKVGEEFELGRSRFDFSVEHTIASVDRSLTRLGTDHLDIVLVHSDGNETPPPQRGGGRRTAEGGGTGGGPFQALDALARCKQAGKVRAIGMSPKTIAGARAAMPLSDVLMLTLNEAEPQMLPVVREARAAGVGVLIKKGLRSGHLPTDTADPIEQCFRYLLAEPGVSSVVVGTINPAHLRHNVGAADAAAR